MEQLISFSKTYRYEILPCKKQSQKVLYVLHGYGQLAKFFIRKFEALNEEYHIVAPEGMHRFYLTGSSGRVGASWMTKEAREHDISDNLDLLNELDDRVSREFDIAEKHLLGFSQGGATAARWFAKEENKFQSIVLWACVFPPDLDMTDELSKFRNVQKGVFVIGSEDQYYNEQQQKELIEYYRTLNFETIQYVGDHNIQTDVLKSIYESNSEC